MPLVQLEIVKLLIICLSTERVTAMLRTMNQEQTLEHLQRRIIYQYKECTLIIQAHQTLLEYYLLAQLCAGKNLLVL
jgi:hypothetical protein